MYVAINNFPGVRRFGISSIKACISGAAPLPVEVQEAFEKLTRGRLIEGYGLTEATTVTHANPLSGRRKVGSIGIPLPSTEAKIVDLATGKDLPPGQLGELAVRGPQVMIGYLGEPESARTWITKDGWLLTGDVARMDADGYFTIVDRQKDQINTAGFKVWPREVEEVLYAHAAVRMVAVIGVADAYRGEAVKACVVLKDEYRGRVHDAELLAFCKGRLLPYKVPRSIEFRDELPLSASGKTLRRLLRGDA
jgi:long-chain acyl-CoA synthetase